jgi:hypothetical protein
MRVPSDVEARTHSPLRAAAYAISAFVLVAAVWTSSELSEWSERRAAASELKTCMLRGPLDRGESPTRRVRRLQLASMTRSTNEPAEEDAWPGMCRASAVRLLSAMRRGGASNADALPLDRLAECLPGRCSASVLAASSLLTYLDSISRGPVAGDGSRIPGPWLTVDDLPSIPALPGTIVSLAGSFAGAVPGPSLPVFVQMSGGPALCEFQVDSGSVSCRSLPMLDHRGLAPGYPLDGGERDPWWCNGKTLRLGGTDDGTMLLFGSCAAWRGALRLTLPATADSEVERRTLGRVDVGPLDVGPSVPCGVRSFARETVCEAELDGRWFTVRYARVEAGGGLRMYDGLVAPWPPATGGRIVFDDHLLDGAVVETSILRDFKVYTHEHVGLLLLATDFGIRAIRIDPDGAVRPWNATAGRGDR